MTIGITQRVEFNKDYNETRDCLDQKWTNLLCRAGIDFMLLPNSLDNFEIWLEKKDLSGFILTGGNDLSNLPHAKNIAPNRDETERKILEWASKNNKRVLGICRGMQLMNCFFSGSLSKVSKHSGNKHLINVLNDEFYLSNDTEVNSFHNWGISQNSLAQKLIPCAYDDSNYIEAARHEKLNWLGMMWHPEREEKYQKTDLEMLQKLFYEGFD